jgi:hypothetical protein
MLTTFVYNSYFPDDFFERNENETVICYFPRSYLRSYLRSIADISTNLFSIILFCIIFINNLNVSNACLSMDCCRAQSYSHAILFHEVPVTCLQYLTKLNRYLFFHIRCSYFSALFKIIFWFLG